MDTVAPKTGHRKQSEKGPADGQAGFEALNAGELFWQPYRSLSRMLLQTHQNLTAYMEVNRSLTNEMQAILRRGQDMALEMSNKMVRRANDATEAGNRTLQLSPPEVDEMYDFAIESVRDLGSAAIDAHIRSLEALRDHARSTMKVAEAARREAVRD